MFRSAGRTGLFILFLSVCARNITYTQEYVHLNDTSDFIRFFHFTDNDSLDYNRPLHIILTLDIKRFYKVKREEEYQPAVLSFYTGDSTRIDMKVRLRSRGEFRKDYCVMPPVRISFKSSGDTAKASIPSLKMVTHCKNTALFEKYLLKEYLVYRLYNLITDYSYRVRLLRIDYVDSRNKVKPMTRYAFIIEPDKYMEKRFNARLVEKNIYRMYQVNHDVMNRLALFQFMIGNTDWHVTLGHNIRLALFPDSLNKRPVPVPFDFDYSGLVDAFYALPHESLGIKSVRERVFMGPCIDETQFGELFAEFNEYRDLFTRMVSGFEILDHDQRRGILYYLDEFYEVIGNRNVARAEIIDMCKKQ